MTLTDATANLLVTQLARQDALFWPIRDPLSPSWPRTWAARREYPSGGMPWRSGGKNAADLKTAERALTELVDSKFVQRFRPRGAKTLRIRITEAGDSVARALADLENLCDGQEILRKVLSFTKKRRAGVRADGWIHERLLVDGNPKTDETWQAAVIAVQFAGMPALVRGWLETNATCQREVYWRVTESGKAIAGDDATLPDGLPAALQNGFSSYLAAFDHGFIELKSKTERLQEIGEIPLSVSD